MILDKADLEHYLRRRASEPGYPERYRPGEIDIQLELRFQDSKGGAAAGRGDEREAARYLPDVLAYLRLEEDPALFSEIRPAGLISQGMARCALFHCWYAGRHQMSIRWYYEFEIPKIRLDWGWRDYGVRDDEAAYRFW